MITINLKSFKKTYSKMDLELKVNFPKVFLLGELIAYNSELNRGCGVISIDKTTHEGTKFTYSKINSNESKECYQNKVQQKQLDLLGNDLINEINLYKESNNEQ